MRIMITKTPNRGYIITNPDADQAAMLEGKEGIYAAVGNLQDCIVAVGDALAMDPDVKHDPNVSLQLILVPHPPSHPYPVETPATAYDPKAPLSLNEPQSDPGDEQVRGHKLAVKPHSKPGSADV